jgi:hypothetical protein
MEKKLEVEIDEKTMLGRSGMYKRLAENRMMLFKTV